MKIKISLPFVLLLLTIWPFQCWAKPIDQTASVGFAVSVADHYLAQHDADALSWDWGDGVFLYGLAKLANVAPAAYRARYTNYIREYHNRYSRPDSIDFLPIINRSDRCPSALSAVRVYLDSGVESGLSNALHVANYIKTESRNRLGALNHLGSKNILNFFYPDSIWVDSLAMYDIFAAQWARLSNDKTLMDFASAQHIIFSEKLQDPGTGLFRHAWFVKREHSVPTTPVYWLRGNGWVAASLVDVLDEVPLDHQNRNKLIQILQKQIAGLVKFQDRNGLWDTVINYTKPHYFETSGTALFAYAIAKGVRKGYLKSEYLGAAIKAYQGVRQQLRWERDGYSMGGISVHTNPTDESGYALIGQHKDTNYGVGAYMLMAAEIAELEVKNKGVNF